MPLTSVRAAPGPAARPHLFAFPDHDGEASNSPAQRRGSAVESPAEAGGDESAALCNEPAEATSALPSDAPSQGAAAEDVSVVVA